MHLLDKHEGPIIDKQQKDDAFTLASEVKALRTADANRVVVPYRLLCLGLYTAYSVAHYFFLPPETRMHMISVSAGTVLIAALAIVSWRVLTPPPWTAHLYGLVITAIIASNILLHIHLEERLLLVTNVAMGMIGISIYAYAYSTFWISMALYVAATAFLMTGLPTAGQDVSHHVIFTVQGLILGVLIFDIRMRLIKRRAAHILAEKKAREEVSRALDRARDALMREEKANEAKSDFLAMMSHEIRTPLNGVIGLVHLMEMQGLKKIGEEQFLDYMEKLMTSGRHLQTVINDILDLSKVEAGKYELDETLNNANEIVEDAVVIVASQAERRGIEVVQELVKEPVWLLADKGLLVRSVINPLINAIRFSEEGSKVWMRSYREADGALVFEIEDRGIGMTPQETKLALQPFQQVDTSSTRKHGGTGLGLYLTIQFVELHQGRLEIDSEKGEGTTIRLVLPAGRLRDRAAA